MLQGCIFLFEITVVFFSPFLLLQISNFQWLLTVVYLVVSCSGALIGCLYIDFWRYFMEVYWVYLSRRYGYIFFWGKMIASFNKDLCCSYYVSNAITASSSWKYLKINQCHLAKSAWKLAVSYFVFIKISKYSNYEQKLRKKETKTVVKCKGVFVLLQGIIYFNLRQRSC